LWAFDSGYCGSIPPAPKVYVSVSNGELWEDTGAPLLRDRDSSINDMIASTDYVYLLTYDRLNGYRLLRHQNVHTRILRTVSAASYKEEVQARGSIVAGFGNQLATMTASAASLPLPTQLAETRVTIKDRAGIERLAPLFFVSPSQINYQIPSETELGMAGVTVRGGGRVMAEGFVVISEVAPALFTADGSGSGAPAAYLLRVSASGGQTLEAVARFDTTLNRFVPVPIEFRDTAEQVFLVLFGAGIRNHVGLADISFVNGASAAIGIGAVKGQKRTIRRSNKTTRSNVHFQTVRKNDQGFAAAFAFLLRVIGGGDDRIQERGTAARGKPANGLLNFR